MSDLLTGPAAPAPAGYTSNLENPEINPWNAPGMWISLTGLIFATIFLAMRVYTKAYLARLFGTDDVLLMIAWGISVAMQVVVIYFWATDQSGVHVWDLTVPEVNNVFKSILTCSILYMPVMALAKFSLLLFYRRLSIQRWFKYAVLATMIFIIAYSVVISLALTFACSPLKRNWDITVLNGYCLNRTAMYITSAACSAFTDVILLLLPIPMIIKLQVPTPQKIGLMIIFGIGSITLVTSCIRLSVLVGMMNTYDATWTITPPTIWICVEANLVICCGCLPVFRLFLLHVAPRLLGEKSNSSSRDHRAPRKYRNVSELGEIEKGKQAKNQQLEDFSCTNEWSQWESRIDHIDDDDTDACTIAPTGQVIAVKTNIQVVSESRHAQETTTSSSSSSVPRYHHHRSLSSIPHHNRLSSPDWFDRRFPSPPSTPPSTLGRDSDVGRCDGRSEDSLRPQTAH